MVNEEYQRGFYYKELPNVSKIFNLCLSSIQNGKVGTFRYTKDNYSLS